MRVKEIFKNRKVVVAVAAALAIVGVTVGATLAYVSSKTDTLTNTFSVGSVDTELKEEITDLSKKPTVKNVGKSDCLVRIRVNVSPSDVGITLDLPKENWVQDGEFYYYTKILAPGESTTELFSLVTLPDSWYKKDDQGEFVLDESKNKIIDADKFVAFDIGLYQEAVQARAFDKDGDEIKAYDVIDGQKVYNKENAKIIWNSYDGAN